MFTKQRFLNMRWLRKLYRPLQPLYKPLVQRLRRGNQNKVQLQHSRQQIQQQISTQNSPYKVIVGAGDTHFAGWIVTDYPALDITKAEDWQQYFAPQSIQRIVAEHVMEHLTTEQLRQFLHAVRPYLTHDARIRIAVPDGYHPDPTYIEYVRPNGSGAGSDDHKVLYTYELLVKEVQQTGFTCELLEYYDAAGQFHRNAWDAADGFIERTGGTRNIGGKQFEYSSLIVDCLPELQ
jgi:predicted SAM-dependent methyltransferase